jgi:hypothetical protein
MGILGFLSVIGGAVSAQTTAIVAWTTQGFNTLFGNLSSISGVLGNLAKWATAALGSIASFIGALWQWLRDSILKKIINVIKSVHDWLKRIFKPLMDWIDRYRKLLRQLQNTYVKPILDFLQRIRRGLYIFRLMGFKWAKKLDDRIVKIETDIERAFLGTWANLNRLADWVNWIVNPFGVFNPSVWFGSIKTSIGGIIAMIQYAQLPKISAYTDSELRQLDAYFSSAASFERFRARASGGPLPDDLAEQQERRALMQAEGLPSPAG